MFIMSYLQTVRPQASTYVILLSSVHKLPCFLYALTVFKSQIISAMAQQQLYERQPPAFSIAPAVPPPLSAAAKQDLSYLRLRTPPPFLSAPPPYCLTQPPPAPRHELYRIMTPHTVLPASSCFLPISKPFETLRAQVGRSYAKSWSNFVPPPPPPPNTGCSISTSSKFNCSQKR